MTTTTIAQKALGISTSPFPQSFDGSGVLFLWALFSLIVISSLATMLGSILARHLWLDRKFGIDAVSALRTLVSAVCVVALMRSVPEVVYMIAYSESSPSSLQTILIAKRYFDILSIIPVLGWMGTFWLWYPDIVLKLRSPTSMIWSYNRLPLLRRFASVVVLSAALALSITIGLAFR